MYKFQKLDFRLIFLPAVSQNNHNKLRIWMLMYEMIDLKLGLFCMES